MATELLTIGNTAKLLGVSIDTLRRWDRAGRLRSVRSGPGGHRYYRKKDIDLFLRDEIILAKQWACAQKATTLDSEVYCDTRDKFQARLEVLQSVLSRSTPIEISALITAVTGEIGNNSFDHNLGNWPDIPGIFFSYNMRNRIVVLADRGQGILTTLKRVRPDLKNASEALKVAFTETVSGRQPEVRGNGLKFVRNVIANNPFTLYFQTGNSYLELTKHNADIVIQHAEEPIYGCFATIRFEETK